MVEIKESPHNPCEMDFNFNLVHVKHAAIDESPIEETSPDSEVPRVYLRVQTLIEFDSFVSTHGPGTNVDTGIVNQKIILNILNYNNVSYRSDHGWI